MIGYKPLHMEGLLLIGEHGLWHSSLQPTALQHPAIPCHPLPKPQEMYLSP
jgi:hypothetical protein